MATDKRLGGKALTAELRKLAAQVHDVTPDGSPLTREAILADLIWKQALGYTDTVVDDDGTRKKKFHAPLAWAQQFLWDRLEGKPMATTPDHESGVRASQTVRELAKQRLNAKAVEAAAAAQPVPPPAPLPPPPKFRPKPKLEGVPV